MKNLGITEFEKEVLRWLLSGDDPVIVALKGQLEESVSIRREENGYGFYLYFEISPVCKVIHPELAVKTNFCFGDVEATIPSLKNGAGFLLWVKNGIINSLEGYTYDEVWPEEIKEFELCYISGTSRDWKELQKQWKVKSIKDGE